MIERILVPLDGSRHAEEALAPARALLRSGGRLLLVHALAPSAGPLERGRAEDYLRSVALRARRPGVRTEFLVVRGEPARAVARAALRAESDLVVLAGRRGHPLGSVAERLVRAGGVPVLLFRAPGRGFLRRMVVPLEGAADVSSALPVVGQVAEALRAEVWLLSRDRRKEAVVQAIDLLTRLGVASRVVRTADGDGILAIHPGSYVEAPERPLLVVGGAA